MARAEPWPASSETHEAASPRRVTRPCVHNPVRCLHVYLAHPVEIQVAAGIQCFQYARAFPTTVSETLPQ